MDPITNSPSTEAKPKYRWSWIKVLLFASLALLVTALAMIAFVAVVIGTNRGQTWLLAQLPGWTNNAVSVTGAQGDVRAGFSAKHVRIELPETRVVLEDVSYAIKDFTFRPRFLHFSAIEAAKVTITPKVSSEASHPPQSLVTPINVRVDRFRVGMLRYERSEALEFLAIEGAMSLDETHRVSINAATWNGRTVRGTGEIHAQLPHPLTAQLHIAQPERREDNTPAWRGTFDITGTPEVMAVYAKVDATGQSLNGKTVLQPYLKQPLSALEAQFEKFDLAKLPFNKLPSTSLTGSANIDISSFPLKVEIDARNDAPGRIDQQRLPARALRVQARGEGRAWTIDRFDADLFGIVAAGRLQGSGAWKDGPWKIDADASSVDLRALSGELPPLMLNGKIEARGNGTDLRTPIAVSARGTVKPTGDRAALPPLLREGGDGLIEATVSASAIDIKSFDAKLAEATVRGSGQATREGSNWAVKLNATTANLDPSRVAPMAAKPQLPIKLNGNVVASALIPSQAPLDLRTLRVDLTLANSTVGSSLLNGNLSAQLIDSVGAAYPSGRWQTEGTARIGNNAATWTGRVGGAEDALRWTATLSDVPTLQALVRQVTGRTLDLPLGQLSGQGTLTGRWPSVALDGTFAMEEPRWQGYSARRLNASVQLGASEDAPLAVDLTAEKLRARDGLILTEADIAIKGRGTRGTHTLTLAATNARVNGQAAELTAQLSGGIDDNRTTGDLHWRGVIDRVNATLANAARPSVPHHVRVNEPVRADVRVGAKGAALRIEPGRGVVSDISTEWDTIEIAYELPAAQIRALLSGKILNFNVVDSARNFGVDSLRGDLIAAGQYRIAHDGALNAQVSLARVSGDLMMPSEEGNALPLGLRILSVDLTADNGLWRAEMKGAGERLGTIAGNVTTRALAAAWLPPSDAMLKGQIGAAVDDVNIWTAKLPAPWRVSGAVDGTLDIGGTLAAPKTDGTLTLKSARIVNSIESVDIKDITGLLRVEGNQFRLENVRGVSGNGNASLSGGGTFAPEFRGEFALNLERFNVLARADRVLDLSGALKIAADKSTIAVDGTLKVDRGRFDLGQFGTPSLSNDVIVVRKIDLSKPTAQERKRLPLKLNMKVDLASNVQLTGRGIDTRLDGVLTLSAPQGRVAVHGDVFAREGTYRAYNQRLTIARGRVQFAGDPTVAQLDILALRPNMTDRVGVVITGLATAPNIRLYAEPERSDTEKLALLVLGREFDALGRDETAIVQQAAMALLSGGDGNVFEKIGLDSFTVRQNAGEAAQTIIGIGKQLSDNLYIGYEQGISATAGTVQLIYRVSRRITLRLHAGSETSVDAIFTWR